MRIAFVVPAPFTTVSGGYVYDRRMVAGLRAAGHVVDVIELAGRHPLADAAAEAAAADAWAALADTPADTRIVIDGLGLPAFAPLAGALAARGVSGLIHHPTAIEPGFGEDDRDRLRAAERALLPRLARVIVTSAPTADQLVKDFGVERARIAIVLPGTAPAARVAGSGGPDCAILAVGTLVPRKGHDVLMRALARLFDLDWHLTIVGSPDRDRVHADGLRALADTLRIAGRVRFAGELGEAELDALWERTAIFALATWWEGYGMAVAEALRRGIPVAVTAGGAAAALVPVEAGITCQPGDVDGYSKALRRMIFDTGLRQDMADAAWRAGQALPDWDAQIAAFAQALA